MALELLEGQLPLLELDLDLLEVPPLEEENLPLFLVLDQSVSSEQVEEPPQTKLELEPLPMKWVLWVSMEELQM